MKDTLFVIPARGGSKGVPGKNIKLLGGKPLIEYTIEVARQLADDQDICVTTDDFGIKTVVENLGLAVPFLRPAELATDKAGTYEVLFHALDFYQSQGKVYKKLVLLQPTSPFRKVWQVQQAMAAWQEGIEMIVSVKETKSNPYYLLFEENSSGFLEKSKKGSFSTRQECPTVYEYNGAIYVIDVASLRRHPMSSFTQIKKYLMEDVYSVDIDSPLDWLWAETLLEKGIVQI